MDLYDALADPVRRAIVELLTRGALRVDQQIHADLAQS
jgi:hypothetical protein